MKFPKHKHATSFKFFAQGFIVAFLNETFNVKLNVKFEVSQIKTDLLRRPFNVFIFI